MRKHACLRPFALAVAILTVVGIGLSLRQSVRTVARRWSTVQLAGLYVVGNPVVFIRFLSVPDGTSEACLRRRLGVPTFAWSTSVQEWRHYVRFRRRIGWSVPPVVRSPRVLVYEVLVGHDLVVFYYFLDADGNVCRVFVGET